MKRPHYDKRMALGSNFRFKLWRPFLCWLTGHKFTCYKIVPTDPQKWVHICNRCIVMIDSMEPCGRCWNGCKDGDEDG